MTVSDTNAMDRAATMFFDRRATTDSLYEEAPYGSKHDDWHPGETAAYIAAAIDRVLATMDNTRDSVADAENEEEDSDARTGLPTVHGMRQSNLRHVDRSSARARGYGPPTQSGPGLRGLLFQVMPAHSHRRGDEPYTTTPPAAKGHTMSTLRDEIIRQVEWAGRDTGKSADNILAAVAEALTSDEAVDAMLYRSYGWADYDEGTTYLDLPEDEKADIRDMGRNEIGAALEAAGIAKGGSRDRKEEGNGMITRSAATLPEDIRLPPGVGVVVYNDATWEVVNDGRVILDLSRIEDEGYHKVIEGHVWAIREKETIFRPPMIRCDEPGNPHVLMPRMRGADHG